MASITVEDLRRLLTAVAGEAEGDTRTGDEFLDTTFKVLGYDSLALMETAARITQEYGVRIPDDRVFGLDTPREILELVNGALAAAR